MAYNYEAKSSYSLTVVVSDSGGLTDSIAVTVILNDVAEAPTVSDATQFKNHAATVGSKFTLTLPAADANSDDGGTYEYLLWKRGTTEQFGENGLTFDARARTLSGTPTNAGTFRLSYQVHDGDSNRSKVDSFVEERNLKLTVLALPPKVSDMSKFKNHDAVVGQAFSLTLPAADANSGNGGPYEYILWKRGADEQFGENGLTFDAATRTVSGTPTATGTFPLVYQIHDADNDRREADSFVVHSKLQITVALRQRRQRPGDVEPHRHDADNYLRQPAGLSEPERRQWQPCLHRGHPGAQRQRRKWLGQLGAGRAAVVGAGEQHHRHSQRN